jgi:hypothetical protein
MTTKLTAPTISTASIAHGMAVDLAGGCVNGATIAVYCNGVQIGTATVTDGETAATWAFEIPTVVAGEKYTVIASKAGYSNAACATTLTAS